MLIPNTHPIPEIVPPQRRAAIAGRRVVIDRLPVQVRRRMRSPEKIGVADHAERYRIVTDGPHPGPWRHVHAPHTVKVMNTFGKPNVREIWFCGVEQSGKTNTMINCLMWCIDCDPGNAFYLMPTEATAAKITGEKIRPVLRQSPRLARYLPTRQDDLTLAKIRLNHGVTIFPAHANSADSMATWSAKHCFGDEVDKYPPLAGREADPITLIKKRNRTYKGRYKRFFASTPAGMFIFKGTMSCPQVWQWRVRCPHCENLIAMDGEHLNIREGATHEDIEAGESVGYVCNHCDVLWKSDDERMLAIRSGMWVCVKGDDLPRPIRVGFHHRAWECLDVPLTEIAIAWLKAQDGSLADKIAWANGYEAVDYVHEQKDRDEDFILRLVDEHLPTSVVPDDTQCLLLKADTQQVGFHYEVWAVGWGKDLPVAVIEHGFVKRFANLVDLSLKEFSTASGKIFRPIAGFIDSGGGTNPGRPKHSRTAEVYDFCRRHRFFKPLKGRQIMDLPWSMKRVDFYPSSVGKKIPIPGGLNLYTINTTYYKNELDLKLQHEPGSSGAIRLHSAVGRDVARQLTAEYRNERGYWECPSGKPNHHWDIMVYGLALADIMGLKNKKKPMPEAARATRQAKQRGGGFVNNY